MNQPTESQIELARSLRQSLEVLHQAGVSSLPKVRVKAQDSQHTKTKRPEPVIPPHHLGSIKSHAENIQDVNQSSDGAVESIVRESSASLSSTTHDVVGASGRSTLPIRDSASKAELLKALNEEVKVCTRCQELAQKRTQTVFGVGNPDARLCFLGEAPGADEDRLGEPFVGRAGQLQDKIIEACGLQRQDVYILNILRCRPPGNRNPTPEEANNCKPFYARQLEIVDPEFIVCLGAVAAMNLLDTTLPVGRLRGTFHTFGNAKVMATYHPSYLLRNPTAKKYVWEDMKMLMAEMGIEVPQK